MMLSHLGQALLRETLELNEMQESLETGYQERLYKNRKTHKGGSDVFG